MGRKCEQKCCQMSGKKKGIQMDIICWSSARFNKLFKCKYLHKLMDTNCWLHFCIIMLIMEIKSNIF